MNIIKAADLKPGMKIKTNNRINGAKNFEIGEVSVRKTEVLFYINTPTTTHRLSCDPTRQFELLAA
tara:strand:+ start:489 stop:686 length:198 start_codon:yes stop_codon:yes gene_type:complete